jgi:hypothetical protein
LWVQVPPGAPSFFVALGLCDWNHIFGATARLCFQKPTARLCLQRQ